MASSAMELQLGVLGVFFFPTTHTVKQLQTICVYDLRVPSRPAFCAYLSPRSDLSTCPWPIKIILIAGKPRIPPIWQPHARINMAQLLGSPVYICGWNSFLNGWNLHCQHWIMCPCLVKNCVCNVHGLKIGRPMRWDSIFHFPICLCENT